MCLVENNIKYISNIKIFNPFVTLSISNYQKINYRSYKISSILIERLCFQIIRERINMQRYSCNSGNVEQLESMIFTVTFRVFKSHLSKFCKLFPVDAQIHLSQISERAIASRRAQCEILWKILSHPWICLRRCGFPTTKEGRRNGP